MADFQVGDRVRVLVTPGTPSHAGVAGEVVRVGRTPDGVVFAYDVRLDGDPKVYVLFRPHELEPEAGGTP